jgi:4-aminobutyrate aminotransferase-like enzyme
VYRVPFNDVEAIHRAFQVVVAAEDVAAIVFEPVQGEGGFIPATQELVEGIRAICDEHGIVMVCDEVQSGYARTGRFFAIEHFGVRPDLITVAKSIAMGIPLSGVLGRAAIMDAPQEGGVGGTYVGNPVAQAAALAVLDVIEEEGLVERSAALGETMRGRMLAWQERWSRILDVRGLGSMLAIELDDAGTASRVVEEALRRGLLLLKAGVEGRAIRVLVPLVVSDAELDEALAAWEQALESAL